VTAAKDPYSGLPTDQRNAMVGLKAQLDQYGLGSLAPQLLNFIQQGYDSNSLSYLLSQTPEYEKRFSGNAARIKNGLAALSPAEYLATERSYRSVLQAANLPNTFYDSPDDYAKLIASDISPDELKTRADHAYKYATMTDPSIRDQLKAYYGIDDAHLAAYFLDPTKGQNLLDKQAMAAEVGGYAKEQGLNVDKAHAESYADLGLTSDQAQSGVTSAALVAPQEKTLGLRFGTGYSDTDATDEFVGGLASARRKREALNSREQALFQGDTQEARAFSYDTSGSY
jgi:hypothetical protein